MAGLLKEIWISTLLEQYDQVHDWMNELTDLSAFVEYNTINLAEAGVDPNVLINNTAYPIASAERTDVAKALPLDTYDTEGIIIRNAEAVQLAYNKMQSVLRRSAQALKNKQGLKASHSLTPASDAAFTPVLPTTGDAENTFKQITEADVFKLARRFDDIDAPQDRILVLHSTHWGQLVENSPTLKEQRFRDQTGRVMRNFLEMAGFKIYKFRSGAVFNKSTGAKVAFGAAAAPTTDTISSFAFVKSEVMKAVGTMEFFSLLKTPGPRGDEVAFQQRFVALPMRDKYTGAIYSDAA